jgi:hypothetical protein
MQETSEFAVVHRFTWSEICTAEVGLGCSTCGSAISFSNWNTKITAPVSKWRAKSTPRAGRRQRRSQTCQQFRFGNRVRGAHRFEPNDLGVRSDRTGAARRNGEGLPDGIGRIRTWFRGLSLPPLGLGPPPPPAARGSGERSGGTGWARAFFESWEGMRRSFIRGCGWHVGPTGTAARGGRSFFRSDFEGPPLLGLGQGHHRGSDPRPTRK